MSTENDDENLSPEEVAALSEAFAPGEARSSDEVRSDQDRGVGERDVDVVALVGLGGRGEHRFGQSIGLAEALRHRAAVHGPR